MFWIINIYAPAGSKSHLISKITNMYTLCGVRTDAKSLVDIPKEITKENTCACCIMEKEKPGSWRKTGYIRNK